LPISPAACTGLSLVEGTEQSLERRIQPLDAGHRIDLRNLAGDRRVVERVERILVLQLRYQQLEKAILDLLGRRQS
jgi:hypothetical protein